MFDFPTWRDGGTLTCASWVLWAGGGLWELWRYAGGLWWGCYRGLASVRYWYWDLLQLSSHKANLRKRHAGKIWAKREKAMIILWSMDCAVLPSGAAAHRT